MFRHPLVRELAVMLTLKLLLLLLLWGAFFRTGDGRPPVEQRLFGGTGVSQQILIPERTHGA